MSNSKMREALTYIAGLASADDARDLPTIAATAQEALAQHADVDEKNQLLLAGIDANLLGFGYIVDGRRVHPSKIKVVVNAAHEAEKAGGG